MGLEREQIVPDSFPNEILQKDWSKRKCFFYKGCKEFLKVVHEMEVKDDDVWIVTYPKCGTTWMQELLWLVINDFDFETALKVDLELRSPFLEFDYFCDSDLSNSLHAVESLKSPRLIKSHLPLPLLPKQLWSKKPKVVHVFRNLKDATVSSFYFSRSLGLIDLNWSLDDYIKQSVKEYFVTSMPYEFAAEFYALRNEPWLYYTSFEKMKKNLRGVIEDVCKFLNKPINEEQMQRMLKHLSFEEMKKNPCVQQTWTANRQREAVKQPFEPHKFIREGGVNTYKKVLSPESIELFDKWIQEQEAENNVTMSELLLLDEI